MSKLLNGVILLPLLTGCFQPEIIIKEVYIPVPAECPKPKDVIEPEYSINSLTEADKGNYQKIAKAYVNSYLKCKRYSKEQETLLDVYRNQKD